jgi:KDO2-lipid IV(A) lauroyltransferase
MRSIPVRLFDAPARVPSGPFWLARATGASIVPVFAYRHGHFRYEIQIHSSRELARDASDAAMHQTAQSIATEMEQFIRSHPTHWFHFAPSGDDAPWSEAPSGDGADIV